MRDGCAALPNLSRALHRLLRELPSVADGTSLTERLILQALESQSATISTLFSTLTYETDPLPLATDFMLATVIERMEKLSEPPFTRACGKTTWNDTLTLTAAGRRLLTGELDVMSMQPTTRWVAGVEVRGLPTWRWDEQTRMPVYR
jgi:hypothetical protein